MSFDLLLNLWACHKQYNGRVAPVCGTALMILFRTGYELE